MSISQSMLKFRVSDHWGVRSHLNCWLNVEFRNQDDHCIFLLRQTLKPKDLVNETSIIYNRHILNSFPPVLWDPKWIWSRHCLASYRQWQEIHQEVSPSVNAALEEVEEREVEPGGLARADVRALVVGQGVVVQEQSGERERIFVDVLIFKRVLWVRFVRFTLIPNPFWASNTTTGESFTMNCSSFGNIWTWSKDPCECLTIDPMTPVNVSRLIQWPL